MNITPDDKSASVTAAEDKLARLNVQVEAMQAVLVRLLQDVVVAEARLENPQIEKLVETNEQLVVAALQHQMDAETAAQALDDAAQNLALDALTQLPNRTMLLDRLERAIASARRNGSRFALLFLDLDGFKPLNDRHGHAFGDAVLRHVAQRLVASVREIDSVSRHGGDEFLVLVADLAQVADVMTVAQKLIAAVRAPVELAGQTVSLSASVGIAVCPDDGTDAAMLIDHADAAMYDSKRRGPGGVAFYGTGQAPVAMPRAAGAAGGSQADVNTLLRDANEKLVLAALDAQALKTAAEAAQQRQVAFVAAVAQELRNPMAPIRIAASMLGRTAADAPLLPRVQGIVEQQMAHMARLVGDLVETSNVEAGALRLDLQPVDMVGVIHSAVAACRPTMDERHQRFESRHPAGPLMVQGDAPRLQQVLSNLLDNASKHTHDGGHIGLVVAASADTLTLTVADDGIGIPPTLLSKIGEPFVQDARALGLHGVGLGIGLTVVRALVRAHGGELVAHSAGVARGSEFTVKLPLLRAG